MIIGQYQYLFGLFIIIPLSIVLIFSLNKRKQMLAKFSSNPIFNLNIKHIFLIKNFRLISAILILVLILVSVFALSAPKWGIDQTDMLVETYDIVFVLDLSKSMNSEDIEPSRLSRAKLEIIEFIHNAKNIRVGLVAFAGSNFIASPLTFDIEIFTTILNSLSSSSMTISGTRIVDSLETASSIFIDNSEADRSLILITDGEEHSSVNQNIVDNFTDKDIRIYSVALGSADGGYIPDFDERGRSLGYKKDEFGKPIVSKRNDALIKMLSENTGGQFYISDNGYIDFDSIYENIKQHSNINSHTRNQQNYKHRFQIFIFIAIIILILEQSITIFISYKSSNKIENE